MKPAFELPEYERRLEKVRSAMSEKNLDALVIGDPANMNWLTGFDAWSFYVPQVMLVLHDHPPVWLGRQMDAGSVALTTHLGADSVRPYAEDLVQRDGVFHQSVCPSVHSLFGRARSSLQICSCSASPGY